MNDAPSLSPPAPVKRRRTFLFWASIVICGGGVAYVLLSGPAAWLMDNDQPLPRNLQAAVGTAYVPMGYMYWRSPQPVRVTIDWYLSFWSDDPFQWSLMDE